MKKRFTILTPTFNRAQLLSRLFESLNSQTFKDFEWIVVDDGSTDNTKEIFKQFKKNAQFEIKYIYQENGGKHRALNNGLKHANSELTFIVDSDDYLPLNSLEICDRVEKTIPENQKEFFCGICGLDGYDESTFVGTTYKSKGFLDISNLDRAKNNILGDKKEVFYSSVLKRFPFPEFNGENFLTEALVWNRIAAAGLKLRFFNDIIYIVDYQADGISATHSQQLINSPKGWALFIEEDIKIKRYSFPIKWNYRYGYYGSVRKKLDDSIIAKYLGLNPIIFIPMMRVIQAVKKVKSVLKK